MLKSGRLERAQGDRDGLQRWICHGLHRFLPYHIDNNNSNNDDDPTTECLAAFAVFGARAALEMMVGVEVEKQRGGGSGRGRGLGLICGGRLSASLGIQQSGQSIFCNRATKRSTTHS